MENKTHNRACLNREATVKVYFKEKLELASIAGCTVRFGSYKKAVNFVPVTQLL